MNKEKFIKAIESYLMPGAEEKREEIEIDNYTLYITLNENKVSISVLNNATNRNIDLSSNKYKNYIKPILDISEGYVKKDCFYIFNLKENITEDTTIKEVENSDKIIDATKNATRNIEDEIIEKASKNNSYKELSIEEVPKRKVGAKDVDFTIEDKNKLNSLLENYDILMELIDNYTTKDTTKNTTSKKIDLSSKNTKVTSIRLNKDLHQELKKRAEEKEESIGELINRAILEYLNK